MESSQFRTMLEEQYGKSKFYNDMKASQSSFANQFNRAQRRTTTIFHWGVIFWFMIIMFWFGNLYKLTQCNIRSFDNPTIVHIIGLVPIASVITYWSPVSDIPKTELPKK